MIDLLTPDEHECVSLLGKAANAAAALRQAAADLRATMPDVDQTLDVVVPEYDDIKRP